MHFVAVDTEADDGVNDKGRANGGCPTTSQEYRTGRNWITKSPRLQYAKAWGEKMAEPRIRPRYSEKYEHHKQLRPIRKLTSVFYEFPLRVVPPVVNGFKKIDAFLNHFG